MKTERQLIIGAEGHLNMLSSLLYCLVLFSLVQQASSVVANRAIWSLSSSKVCLAMSDISYDPFGTITEDVSEELRQGLFGQETLYCKRGCCGDNRDPFCCPPDDDVGQSQFATYKLITVIAAGVGGLAIIGVIVVAVVKWHLKKRRLVRDIQAINSMNRMTDMNTKIKVIGAPSENSKKSKKDKKKDKGEDDGKKSKLFTNSKKAPLVHVKTAPFVPAEVPPPASYATLSSDSFLNHQQPSRAVGNLPVFLPNPAPGYIGLSQVAPLPNVGASAAAGHTGSSLSPLKTSPVAAGVSQPREPPTMATVFSTPLASNPVVFSGPYGNTQDSPRDGSGSSSSKKSSTKSNVSSPRPDIPWDDADLLLYFSDPPTK